MFKLLSACCVALFLINTVVSLYLATQSDFASSIGFGLLASVFFVLLVVFGYLGLRK